MPNEIYARAVYGENMFSYELFDELSLATAVMNIVNYNGQLDGKLKSLQADLIEREEQKYSSVLQVFDEVVNVPK